MILVLAHSAEGMLAAHLGQWPQAIRLYQRAIAEAQMLDDRDSEADLITNLGTIQYLAEHIPEAIQCFQQARERYGAIGQIRGLVVTLIDLGSLYRDTDDLAEAQACYQAALGHLANLNGPISKPRLWPISHC